MNSSVPAGRHHGPTFIYGLVDPRNHQLRYIGKTVRQPARRLATHLWQARISKQKRHVLAWLTALQADNVSPEIVEIETVVPFGDWEEAEQFWIAYFRFVDADLCNLTIGGDGAPGAKMSEERKAQLRARCGPLSPMFGKPMHPATREALRDGNRRLRADPVRHAAAIAKRRAGFTPETIAQMTERLAAIRSDPTRNAKREIRRKEACRTDEFRSKVGAWSSGQWASRREEIIAAQNAGKDDQYKRKQSEARKQAWIDPKGPYRSAFLSPSDRETIRRHLRSGMTGAKAAKKFGLSQSRISQIKHGA